MLKDINDEIFQTDRNIADLQRNYKSLMMKLNVKICIFKFLDLNKPR
jgi:hypothetical protein